MSLAIALALNRIHKRQHPSDDAKKKRKQKRQKAENGDGDGKAEKKEKKLTKKQEKKEKLLKSIASDCVWSETQDKARRFLLDKKRRSCFLSGGAGTGKSKLLQYVTGYWRAHTNLSFNSTASIGTAAFSLQGTTLHRFVGLPLPLFESGNIDAMIRALKKWAKSRILGCQLLIIDEVSIVSQKTLETVSSLMQRIRGNYEQPFGGVALICCGDFCQLRPTSGANYAFESDLWPRLFPPAGRNIFLLKEQFRQKDDVQFTRMLNHVRSGVVTPEVELFFSLCELNKEDADEVESTRKFTYLASRREAVEAHNQRCYEQLRLECPNYPVRVYRRGKMPCEAPDYISGKAEDLAALEKRIPVEIELVAGARIMITTNLGDPKEGLVNGRCGTVCSVSSEAEDGDSVQVVLDGTGGAIESIAAHTWQARDTKTGDWFELSQLPIQRSWGFTIHKSQGQTFYNGVLVNARDIPTHANEFSYGQFYVAASRARCRSQFSVIGWHKNRVHADPKVLRWYASTSIQCDNLFPQVTEDALDLVLSYYV